MNKTYQTDIVIVNFNTADDLKDCLASIREHSNTSNNYHVCVVDNGSSDHSISLIRSNNWISGIFNKKNLGYGAACNQGILAGKGEYIFLLNSDIQVTSGWLSPLIATLSKTDVAVVGPRLVNPQNLLVGVGVVGTNANPVIRGWGEPNDPSRYNQSTECLSVGGACMGIKRTLLAKLGLFDENYFHYFEETDYCYNARFHGFKVVYCPDSSVIHRVGGSCRNNQLLQKYYQNGQRYFQRKWKNFLSDPTIYE